MQAPQRQGMMHQMRKGEVLGHAAHKYEAVNSELTSAMSISALVPCNPEAGLVWDPREQQPAAHACWCWNCRRPADGAGHTDGTPTTSSFPSTVSALRLLAKWLAPTCNQPFFNDLATYEVHVHGRQCG